MKTRKPNTGPYVVTYSFYSGGAISYECHTWAEAVRGMRNLLISGAKVVKVSFV